MGLQVQEIKFDSSLPALPEIQARFYDQTGLRLRLLAELSLRELPSSNEHAVALLQEDVERVGAFERREKELYASHKGEHELLASIRDSKMTALDSCNRILELTLTIDGFYNIEFAIAGNSIEVGSAISAHYGFLSLIRVLLELGGKPVLADGLLASNYTTEWNKLRPWHQYRWYNRPPR
jgi:hypothetical protein